VYWYCCAANILHRRTRDAVNAGNVYRFDPGERAAAKVPAASWFFTILAMGLKSRSPTPARSAHLRGNLLARLRERGPAGTRTVRAVAGEWQAFAPGVTIKLLRRNASTDSMTAFIRMQPGAALAGHAHTQSEECLILEGEIFIGMHRLCVGDQHIAAIGTLHAPIASPRGALLLVRAQLCGTH
jgi:hypothetical protein